MTQEFAVLHLFSGIGGAAIGFQQAVEEYKGMVGRFRTLAGIDVDSEACADFEALTGAQALEMDLFSREEYISFHGHKPPADWREVTAGDLLVATKGAYPDVVFLSPPCKGFSGLLPSQKATSAKYQALNHLVVHGLKLVMEAFQDNLPSIIMLENVPRITSRGQELLREVKNLLGAHGYLFHEGYHDCGKIGGLAQHRKRYLLIARHQEKMSAFVYRPPLRQVKAIGNVLDSLPFPDDPALGSMHHLPRLQWKTWVRLALIPAGGDWRNLEKIAPYQYQLEYIPRGGGPFGVQDWNKPSSTVIGNASIKGSNAAAVADPRLSVRKNRHPAVYQVVKWDESGPCVTGCRFGSGAAAIADPRTGFKPGTHTAIYRVTDWNNQVGTITGAVRPNNGAPSIADPRLNPKSPKFNHSYKMSRWDEPASVIAGGVGLSNGAIVVDDPRLNCKPRSGTMGVQDWNQTAKTVIGAGDIHAGSAAAIADPRIPSDREVLDPPPIIIALDGTWHRPLTTLELAALQGFPVILPDGKPLKLAGNSDARWRERIGNAVPPPTARVIGEQILFALMVSARGEWTLGSTGIWVKKMMRHNALDISVNT